MIEDRPPEGAAPGPADGLLRHAAAAASLAADRPGLWAPAGLASVAFLGWLPFVLAVWVLPSPGDLAFFGAGLATSASFPVNVVLLVGSAVLVMVAASVLVASGEAALQAAVRRSLGWPSSGRTPDDAAARLWVVQVVAALPALAALAAAAIGVVAVAPGEYQSPDIGGPLALRIAGHVWPFLALGVVLAVGGVAFGAAAQRAAVGPARTSLAGALADGLRALARRPLQRIGLAAASLATLTAWLAATWALLHLLWLPIARSLAAGRLLEGGTPLLLVGFVAIWLCLIAAGGALHAWGSAWWTLELAEREMQERRTA